MQVFTDDIGHVVVEFEADDMVVRMQYTDTSPCDVDLEDPVWKPMTMMRLLMALRTELKDERDLMDGDGEMQWMMREVIDLLDERLTKAKLI